MRRGTINLLIILAVSVSLFGCDLFGTGKKRRNTQLIGDGSASCEANQTSTYVDGEMICVDLADLCTISSDCETGNDCINGFCVPITAPDGQCSNHTPDCLATEFCNFETSLCEDKKPIDTICNVSYCSFFCSSGQFYTSGDIKKCGCSNNSHCSSLTDGRNTCHSSSHRCVVLVGFNQACNLTQNKVCSANLQCTSPVSAGTCKKINNQPCTANGDCISEYCNPTTNLCSLEPGGCQAGSLPAGSSCTAQTAGCCQSGVCNADEKCGCYSASDCTGSQYCAQVGLERKCQTGCALGNTISGYDQNSNPTYWPEIQGSCQSNYYCDILGECTARCDNGFVTCNNSSQFCNVNVGGCEQKLGYGSQIPEALFATNVCESGYAQQGTTLCGCNTDSYCQQIANQNYDYCDADNKCKKIIWSFNLIGGSSGWAYYINTGQPLVKFVSDGSKVFGVTQGQENNYYIVNNLIQLSPNANNTFSVLQKPLSSGQSNTTLSNIPGVMAYDGKVNIVTEFNYLSSNRHNVSVIDITGAKASSLLEFKPAYGLLSVVSGKFNADNSFDFVGIKAPAVSTNPPIFLAFYKNTGSTSTAAFNEPVQLTLQNATGIGYDKIRDIVSGDFNNDGKTDILTIYMPQAGQCEIYVWENQGNNTLKAVKWKASHSFPLPSIAGRVVVGDFNGDGKLDLAAVENINNADQQIAIHVWTNTGTATFSDPSAWFTTIGGYKASKIKGVVSGKFYNSDNKSEIVILYQYVETVNDVPNTPVVRAHVFAPSTSEQ